MEIFVVYLTCVCICIYMCITYVRVSMCVCVCVRVWTKRWQGEDNNKKDFQLLKLIYVFLLLSFACLYFWHNFQKFLYSTFSSFSFLFTFFLFLFSFFSRLFYFCVCFSSPGSSAPEKFKFKKMKSIIIMAVYFVYNMAVNVHE